MEDMAVALRPGEYFGSVRRRTSVGGVALNELHHRTARELPEHRHDAPYFCLLLSGDYVEQVGHREISYRPYSTGFHPQHLTHRDRVGRNGARFFTVEFPSEWLQAAAALRSSAGLEPSLLEGDLAVSAVKLYRQHLQGTLTGEGAESIIWELLECVIRGHRITDASKPRWLERCIDLLHAEFSRPLTVAGVAAAVDVHPVHLSREFRRRFGQTVGEYLHRLRVRSACAQMEAGRPLGDIALAAGFYDQSHFSRVFKRLIGCAPGRFRRLALE